MPARPWQINQQRAKPAIGYVSFTGNSANTETITIGARIYEVQDGALTVGAVKINTPNGSNAPTTLTAAVAAINGDTSRAVDALDIGGNVMALVHRNPGTAGNIALAEGLGNGSVSGAALTEGAAEGLLSLHADSYAITAQDVTTLALVLGTTEIVIGGFPSTTQPLLFAVRAHTSTGVVVDLTDGIFTFRQVNTNQWALCYAEPAAGALLAATDVIEFLAGVGGV